MDTLCIEMYFHLFAASKNIVSLKIQGDVGQIYYISLTLMADNVSKTATQEMKVVEATHPKLQIKY